MSSTDADGVRSTIRNAYHAQKERLVWQELPEGMTLYSASLYGALSCWYRRVGRDNPSEVQLLAELVPFVQLTERLGVEMLAEYAVFMEMPHECKLAALADSVQTGVSHLGESERDTLLGEAGRYHVAWMSFLA